MGKHSNYGWFIAGILVIMVLISTTTPLVQMLAEGISGIFSVIGAFFGKFLSVIRESEPTFSTNGPFLFRIG